MSLAAVCGILALTCFISEEVNMQDGSHSNSSQPPHEALVSFADVLEIAKNRSPDAREKLLAVEHTQGVDRLTRLLASKTLQLWVEDQRTYFSQAPALLEPDCVNRELFQSVYGQLAESSVVVIDIHVGVDGRPLRVELLKGGDDRRLREAIVTTLMQSRYLPAKPDEDYVAGKVTALCRLEVR